MARISLRTIIAECGGSCGDLGTFIPHVIGAITVAGLAPFGVLFGFAVFLIGSGWFYEIPMAVQPMKAVSAVILTAGMTPGEIAAAGMILGVVLLVLGISGLIGRVARIIPQSVSAGLQLGLGLLMGTLGVKLILMTPVIGIVALVMLFALARVPHCPAAPVTLVASAFIGWAMGSTTFPDIAMTMGVPQIVVPNWSEIWRGFEIGVVPQLALTLTNAVIVTASLSRELFPLATAATERNLAVSSGMANILLSPFGAMPMCHGAGGLQAQYRFGGRTGLTPIILGAVLLVLATLFSTSAARLFGIIPIGAVGALLILAGTDLALSRRLFDSKPSCRPVIAVTALLTLLANPALGLLVGLACRNHPHGHRATARPSRPILIPEESWVLRWRSRRDSKRLRQVARYVTLRDGFARTIRTARGDPTASARTHVLAELERLARRVTGPSTASLTCHV